MQDTEAEKKEIKRRFQLWIRPSTLELADTLYKKDNCDSRSEFIEKAVIFYAGYLTKANISTNKGRTREKSCALLCITAPYYHSPKILNQIPWIYTEGISDGKQVFGCQVASLCLA